MQRFLSSDSKFLLKFSVIVNISLEIINFIIHCRGLLVYFYQVVHPAPGNATGTLVNGVLHHCSLPTVAYSDDEALSDVDHTSDNESSCSSICAASVRPGIVHRLDKGTSGLLVVAKVLFIVSP